MSNRQPFYKEPGLFDRVNNSHNEEIFRDVKDKVNINKLSDERRRKLLGLDFLNKMNSNDLKRLFLKGKLANLPKENGNNTTEEERRSDHIHLSNKKGMKNSKSPEERRSAYEFRKKKHIKSKIIKEKMLETLIVSYKT